jgi:hypothetical protein
LPLGPVRERILEICGIRRLLPVVMVESHVTALRLVNDDAESLLRVEIHEQSARTPDGERCGPLGIRIHLLAEPYHEGVCREVEAILLDRLVPAPAAADTPLLTEALAACGRRPGGYSSKIDNRLDPDQRADEALKTLLRSLHQTLLANLEGARNHLDTEFLHDLRVATRRTRSALGQVKGVLPSERVEDF